MLRTALIVLMATAAAFAAPLTTAADVSAPPTEARLARYLFDVQWRGAEGRLPKEGQIKVMLQADLEANQQVLHLVSAADESHLGRVIQAGTTAFVGLTGQDTFPVLDLMLGAETLGFPVGMATAVEWLQGKDASGPVATAVITRGENGLPTRLVEDGWIVDYTGWANAGDTGFAMPQHVTISREGSSLRLDLALAEGDAFSSTKLPEGYRLIQVN